MLKPIKAAVRRALERKTFSLSQAGQDVWVFDEVFNVETNRCFVDVGAHDGIFLSNTFVLEPGRLASRRTICPLAGKMVEGGYLTELSYTSDICYFCDSVSFVC